MDKFVSESVEPATFPLTSVTAGVSVYSFSNSFSTKNIEIRLLETDSSMKPSFSSRFLIDAMKMTPGARVLDLGAGTGVVGIAASLLGAGEVVAVELDCDLISEISTNSVYNQISNIKPLAGDLFAPVYGELFDLILLNPPSTPSLPADCLPLCYFSGESGREILDRALDEFPNYLAPGGVFTFVQSSLANKDYTIQLLRERGHRFEVLGPVPLRVPDHINKAHLEYLSELGHAKFIKAESCYMEFRYIVSVLA